MSVMDRGIDAPPDAVRRVSMSMPRKRRRGLWTVYVTLRWSHWEHGVIACHFSSLSRDRAYEAAKRHCAKIDPDGWGRFA